MSRRIAIVLFNLGGPDNEDAVRPFLFNLFADPAIIRLPNPLRIGLAWAIAKKRSRIAKGIYTQIGGASPLLRSEEHTSELQSLMRISYAVFCLKKNNN